MIKMWHLCQLLLFVAVVWAQDEANVTATTTETPTTTTTEAPTTTTTSTTTSSTTASPGCEFPHLVVGDWWTTILPNKVTFNDNNFLPGINVNNRGTTQFDCYMSNEDNYILRSSTTFEFHELLFYHYFCLSLERINDNYFEIIIKTGHNDEENDEPVAKRVTFNTGDEFSRYCDNDTDVWTRGILLRVGHELEGASTCADLLDGEFNVTYPSPNTQRVCPNGAQMDSCRNQKIISFDYTSCSDSSDTGMSSQDEYVCVSGTGNDTVVQLWRNSTEVNAFTPFSCLNLEVITNPTTTTAPTTTAAPEEGNSTNSTISSTPTPAAETPLTEIARHEAGACSGGTWYPQEAGYVPETEVFNLIKTADCSVATTETPTTTTAESDESTHYPNNGTTANNTDTGPEDGAPKQTGAIWLLLLATLASFFLQRA